MQLLAHAEELHTTSTTALEHYLTQPWTLLGVIVVIVALCWRFAGSWRLPAILGVLFVGGIAGYRWSPWVSVFCISAGFSLALLMMLSGGGVQPAEDETIQAE